MAPHLHDAVHAVRFAPPLPLLRSSALGRRRAATWIAADVERCGVDTWRARRYEVAFLEPIIGDPLYVVNRFVDFCFVVDLFINFNLSYYDDEKAKFVRDRGLITQKVRWRCSFVRT